MLVGAGMGQIFLVNAASFLFVIAALRDPPAPRRRVRRARQPSGAAPRAPGAR